MQPFFFSFTCHGIELSQFLNSELGYSNQRVPAYNRNSCSSAPPIDSTPCCVGRDTTLARRVGPRLPPPPVVARRGHSWTDRSRRKVGERPALSASSTDPPPLSPGVQFGPAKRPPPLQQELASVPEQRCLRNALNF